MDSPASRVIEPKLMPPRVHPGMLRRARLLEMLGDEASFTILNAAVGYGKTTLVRSWCVERPEAVIWVTLDSADGDPVRLWTHLATAVERLGEGFGRRALSCLAVRGASVESAVDEVMNGLVAYGRRVTIVLDDMHAVRSDASVRSIAQAIERLPANARLVASTRSDPAIGLGRLRAGRGVTEVRARELAFTVEEAGELVVREGIDLSTQSVELLVDRTEGWPAGVYLAALWLRDLRDPNQGVREFAGSTRQVGEYLAEEVLTALAPEIKDFLVRTSVLGRFTPELCDAVLGREDSLAVLADLAHSNMFLVALDNRGKWYRYHHLFGEVLQLELGPEAARELRRRAAAWCRAQGLVEEAIEYAAAAEDADMVADLLIERHLEFIWGGRLGQFLGWVRWLPAEMLVQHPVLPGAGAVAAALLAAPEIEVQQFLAIAERARQLRPDLWSPYIEAGLGVVRSETIQRGDVGAAVAHARGAVAAAQTGADVLTVSALRAWRTRCFSPASPTRRAGSHSRRSSDPMRPMSPTPTSPLSGCSRWSTPSRGGPKAPRRGLVRHSASRASISRRTRGSRRCHTSVWRSLAPRPDASTRPSARHSAASVCDARHSPPSATRTRYWYLLRCGWRESRLARAARDLERAERAIAEFPDPGRLPAIAARIEQIFVAARANAGSSDLVEEPSPAELAVLRGLAAGLSRREIGAQLYISLNTVKSHTRELYRKLGATSQTEAVARAEALGLLEPSHSPG